MDKGIEALIAKVKKQTESFDTAVLKEDEAKALIAALEQAQTEREEFRMRLKLERSILADADKRIAELEKTLRETEESLISATDLIAELEARTLSFKLPEPSSKAFWGGVGKNETFYPSTYKLWLKEAIERAGIIAGVKIEVI